MQGEERDKIFWIHDIAQYVAIGNSKSDVHIQNEWIMLSVNVTMRYIAQ